HELRRAGLQMHVHVFTRRFNEGANPWNNELNLISAQLVFLAFDGAITTTNYNNYTFLLNNRVNSNGCPIGMTFFVYHEYNDYTLTHTTQLHRQIGLTSQSPSGLMKLGARAPFLQSSGDDTFTAMKNLGMFYDCSFPETSVNRTNPPIWPYTMDQGFQHECTIPPCPKDKYPGIWTVPMVKK
ncbi:hypothetical protein DAPPUDRAFT_273584, partial [Daphnia pulex]